MVFEGAVRSNILDPTRLVGGKGIAGPTPRKEESVAGSQNTIEVLEPTGRAKVVEGKPLVEFPLLKTKS